MDDGNFLLTRPTTEPVLNNDDNKLKNTTPYLKQENFRISVSKERVTTWERQNGRGF